MRFSSKNKLDWALGILHQPEKPLSMTEQQRPAFVSREAASETDRQDIGIENTIDLTELFGRFAQANAMTAQAVANKIDQAALQQLMCFPQNVVRNVNHPAPV